MDRRGRRPDRSASHARPGSTAPAPRAGGPPTAWGPPGGTPRANFGGVGPDRPIKGTTPQAGFGAHKPRLLSSAKLLQNIHGPRRVGTVAEALPPYFEWARAVE